MVKLALDKLNKRVPPMKPKMKALVQVVKEAIEEQNLIPLPRRIVKPVNVSRLERTPKKDTFVPKSSQTSSATTKDTKMRLGDFWVNNNKKLAEEFLNDLDSAVREVPGATFIRELNTSSAKELTSALDKLASRKEQFSERGFRGVVRDGVRATAFMPDADKNYMKLVDVMRKKGYQIADTFAEDASGNLIIEGGKPKMTKDLDVRFGDNAVPSGYEDVQMRLKKKDVTYELLILPGPNYMAFKNKEHKMIFEKFKAYGKYGVTDDPGAKQIVKALKKEFHKVTKLLYKEAKMRDTTGSISVQEPATFTSDGITTVNKLFKSLKDLFRGRYEALPPSKRKKDFKETKMFLNVDALEKQLREFMEMYKPIEK